MSAEIINERLKCMKFWGAIKKSKYVEGEIVLPDIKPDILSVVKLCGNVLRFEEKTENENVKILGAIDVCGIYLADDETSSVKSFNLQLNFSEDIEIEGAGDNLLTRVFVDLGDISYKVVNGRKIQVKALLNYEILIYETDSISVIKEFSEDLNMQYKKTTKEILCPLEKVESKIELKETLNLLEESQPISEILYSSINIVNREFKVSYNKILAKAEAKIKMIYVADNEKQSIEIFETTVPVMGFLDSDLIGEESKISIEYLLKNFTIKPVYQDLRALSVILESDIKIQAYIKSKKEVDVVSDFYSPYLNVNVKSQNVNCIEDVINLKENIELSEGLVVPELSETKILNICGVPKLNEKTTLNGKIAITGNIDIEVLYCMNDGKIAVKKLELPFGHVIKNDSINDNSNPLVNLHIECIDFKVVGENEIHVTIELAADIIVNDIYAVNSIEDVQISDEGVSTMPSLIIYFVKKGDSLWNIAKKYRSTVTIIKEFNDLTTDMIYPGDKLLIPRISKETVKLIK